MTFLPRKPKNKYGAMKTADGFPSKLEAAVYQLLLLREKAGEIKAIKRQASVSLGYGIRWKVDFSFERVSDGTTVWAEAKGVWSRDAKLKLRMWKEGAGPGPLEIWMGHYRKPVLYETVVPRNKESK